MTQTSLHPAPISPGQVPPLAEVKLWSALKQLKRQGHAFRRCAAVGPHVVDYLCPDKKVIVEVDAAPLTSPAGRAQAEARMRDLEARGYRVLRFWDDHVEAHLDGVLVIVRTALNRTEGTPRQRPRIIRRAGHPRTRSRRRTMH